MFCDTKIGLLLLPRFKVLLGIVIYTFWVDCFVFAHPCVPRKALDAPANYELCICALVNCCYGIPYIVLSPQKRLWNNGSDWTAKTETESETLDVSKVYWMNIVSTLSNFLILDYFNAVLIGLFSQIRITLLLKIQCEQHHILYVKIVYKHNMMC